MGLRGTLTKAAMGFSMPVRSPLFPPPPYHYKGARLLAFPYLTDAKAAASFLPDCLSLPDAPTAGFVFASYPWSTLGPYEEVVQYIDCLDDGVPKQFATALYVTSDAAMAAGREAAGFPKKIAKIDVRHDTAYVASLERPGGLHLAAATLQPDQPNPLFTLPHSLHYLTLRLIPNPLAGAAPSLTDLVETTWVVTSGGRCGDRHGLLPVYRRFSDRPVAPRAGGRARAVLLYQGRPRGGRVAARRRPARMTAPLVTSRRHNRCDGQKPNRGRVVPGFAVIVPSRFGGENVRYVDRFRPRGTRAGDSGRSAPSDRKMLDG